jgi:rod shape-determining protein MreD
MNSYKAIRYLGYALELLVVFILQETPGLIPPVYGARPVLLIPVTVSVAMFENETASMLFGLAGGLLIDFGYGGILGFHGLMLAAACYAISLIAANLLRTNFLTAMLISVIAAGCAVLLQWIFFYVLFGYGDTVYALTAHYLPIFCYTAVFAPLAYYFNRAIALQVRSKEE